MTVNERIRKALEAANLGEDSLDRLIAAAYYIGREESAKDISDRHTAQMEAAKDKAAACRYHRMAAEVISDLQVIYSTDYAGEVGSTFGGDETAL